jgi:hypothetical protein
MKSLFTFLTCLVLSLPTFSQNQFHKAAANPSGQNANDVVQLSDGSFVTIGTSGNFSAPFNDIFVLRVDAQGDTLWSRVFQGLCEETARSITALANDNIIIAGTACFGSNSGNDALLLKISKHGNILFAKGFYELGSNQAEFINDVIATSDGGIAATGGFGTSTMALKTDSAGLREWTMTYGNFNGVAIYETSDSGFIIAADSSTSAIVIKTSSTGSMEWKKSYQLPQNSSITPVDIIENAAGYQLLGTANVPVDGDQALVMQLDSLGDTLWTKTYGNLWSNQVTSLSGDAHGATFVGTTNGIQNLTSAAWIVRINPQGDTLWTRTYGPFGDARSVIRAADQGFLAVGQEFGFAGQFNHAYLLKTDSMGFTVGCPQSIMPSVSIATVSPTVNTAAGAQAFTPDIADSSFTILNPPISYDDMIAEIDGSVTSMSLPVDMANVNLYEFTMDSTMLSISATSPVDANGDFSFKGLTGNNYILQASPDTMAFPARTPTWSGFEYRWPNAGKIMLAGCAKRNASVGLDDIDGGSGMGKMGGTVTAGPTHPSLAAGDPVEGVPIFLIQNFFTIIRMGYTDMNGKYEFDQVPLGTYQVWADIPVLPIDSQHTQIQLTSLTPTNLGLDYIVDADRITGRQGPLNVGISPLFSDVGIKVYPNPVGSDLLYFSQSLNDVQLFNLHGQLLIRERLAENLYVGELAAGTYLLKSKEGHTMIVVK